MKDTIKEVYDILQAGKNVSVFGVFRGNRLGEKTLYCDLYCRVNNNKRLLTSVGNVCPSRDVLANVSEGIMIMALATLVGMLSTEANKVNGISFTNLYMKNASCIAELIQRKVLYVGTHKDESCFVSVNATNVISIQQVQMLLALLGYTIERKQTPVYTTYVLSKWYDCMI